MEDSSLLNLFFPENNVCLLCSGALLEQEDWLCARCREKMNRYRIPPPESRIPGENLVYALSAWWHDGEPAQLVRLLKYGGVPIAARVLGEGMTAAARIWHAGESSDLLIPVPVHPQRLRERGYNQSEKLAAEIARGLSLPCCPEGLERVQFRESQVGQTREERLSAMAGVFRAVPEVVRGKRVLLVDDVLTTGATGSACAAALLEGGAAEVRLLTANRA